jgi:hypothetical protein
MGLNRKELRTLRETREFSSERVSFVPAYTKNSQTWEKASQL